MSIPNVFYCIHKFCAILLQWRRSAQLILLASMAATLMAMIWRPQILQASTSRVSTPASPRDDDTDGAQSLGGQPQSTTLGVRAPVSSTLFLPLLDTRRLYYFPIVSVPNAVFSDPFPRNEAMDRSPNANLLWSVQPNGADVTRYRVYLEADDDTPDVLMAETTDSNVDPPTFELSTRYFWQVVAIDSIGHKIGGPIWSFVTEDGFSPDKLGSTVHVPAGQFAMGCDYTNPQRPKECWGRELPLHGVYLDAYEIDKYEVTNGEYLRCVEAGVCNWPRKTESHRRDDYFGNPAYEHFPVLFISWWDSQEYCQWVGKRLPTEAEWEKAARGSIDTRPWPWGHEPINCARANFLDDSNDDDWIICTGDTVQVGSYPSGASPYGAMDMSGNVFEWVADVWREGYYAVSPYYNPTGPGVSKEKRNHPAFVIRGGSYRPHWFYPQTNHRHWGHHGDGVGGDEPFFRNDQVGFRCARSAPTE